MQKFIKRAYLKGFYADEGIDVQLREFEVGKLLVDEMKKGVLQVDFEKENGAYKLLVKIASQR